MSPVVRTVGLNGVLPVAVCIPTIPPRAGGLCGEAIASVMGQTRLPSAIVLATDADHEGAAVTRQAALDAADEEWVSFLDDDDLWHPHHLETHWDLLHQADADVAYSWFDGNNPFPKHRGRAYDPNDPHHLTMTLTVRTELAKKAGFLQPDGPMHTEWSGEDWQFQLRLRDLGAKFVGTGEVTWTYRVHGDNTSGLASRW